MRNSVKTMFYSPTGTTRRIVEEIAEEIGSIEDQIDLTHSGHSDTPNIEWSEDDLVIFGLPVYGGRAQKIALNAMKAMRGNGASLVGVVVYGNRAFEDALRELLEAAEAAGFRPVAGAAFVGEHSFSSDSTPIAHGRPDAEDLTKAAAFGRAVLRKMGKSEGRDIGETIPGQFPYKESSSRQEVSPIIDHEVCIQCSVCTNVCPTSAARLEEKLMVDKNLCILCCACIKACPVGALALDERMRGFAHRLSAEQSDRKEPVWFL